MTEVGAAIRGLKFGKTAGENEIRRKMLKALKERRWLTKSTLIAKVCWLA